MVGGLLHKTAPTKLSIGMEQRSLSIQNEWDAFVLPLLGTRKTISVSLGVCFSRFVTYRLGYFLLMVEVTLSTILVFILIVVLKGSPVAGAQAEI